MDEISSYLSKLLAANGFNIAEQKNVLYQSFASKTDIISDIKSIINNQKTIVNKWALINRLDDIEKQQIYIPNGTINKPYKHTFDLNAMNCTDFIAFEPVGLEELGLSYNAQTKEISGTPIVSGDLKISLRFKIVGEEEEDPAHNKIIPFIINPDPKSLWKDIESDQTDLFAKADNHSIADTLGEKNIVVSSKRGRSHKNVGSYREDDFAYKHIKETAWNVVTVSDGAGSYPLSRMGSKIACESVITYFENIANDEKWQEFENKIAEFNVTNEGTVSSEIDILSKQLLYKAAAEVHNKIKAFAEEVSLKQPEKFNNPKAKSLLDYFHCTLVFALFKKYDFGYLVLSFGVGDCPIALVNKDKSATTMLNWLDVGEFGGGTRFITQPEIFHSTEHPIITRFNSKIINDFSFLVLMSDGIYDPKFVVESALEKQECWNAFFADLNGENEEQIKVNFSPDNNNIANELSDWMEFWSPGNHDDRTLAIIY